MPNFVGSVRTEWIKDARIARLLDDLAYYDFRGYAWLAPRGSIIDVISVPRIFWARIGAPFTSMYWRTAVVHDVACVEKKQTWRETHHMFYEACRYDGLSRSEAALLYAIVYRFGPRWGDDVKMRACRPLNADKAQEALEQAISYFNMRACDSFEDIEKASNGLFHDIT